MAQVTEIDVDDKAARKEVMERILNVVRIAERCRDLAETRGELDVLNDVASSALADGVALFSDIVRIQLLNFMVDTAQKFPQAGLQEFLAGGYEKFFENLENNNKDFNNRLTALYTFTEPYAQVFKKHAQTS